MGRRKNKWFKKTINFYRYIFKFEVPFSILVDGNFVAIALKKKFDMKDLWAKTLDEKVRLIITSCVFKEWQSWESKIPGWLGMVSKYQIEECNHNAMEPTHCIKNHIGKKNMAKYFVATQDPFLRTQLRQIPGVPLLFFEQNMILVDKVSFASLNASERREMLKEDPQKKEKIVLKNKKDEAKEFMMEEFKQSGYYKRKQEEFKLGKLMGNVKKKALGPNPLSVKKKQSVYWQRAKLKGVASEKADNEDGKWNETGSGDDKRDENNEIKMLKKKRTRGKKKKGKIEE